MKKRSKIALAATGLVAISAASFVTVMGVPAATPALADLAIGTPAPDFRVADADGRTVSLSDFAGKTVVLEWNNPKCPTVKEHYESGTMQKMQAATAADGVVWLTINSGGPWRQGHMDGDEAKEYVANQKAQPTAYLLDPEGHVGRSYGAKTTPHMFIVDQTGTLVYRGAVQEQGNVGSEGGNLVLAALSELKAGKPVSTTTSRPYGCSVKYKG